MTIDEHSWSAFHNACSNAGTTGVKKMSDDPTMRLCRIDQLPRHLQFNRYIANGYRRPLSLLQCLDSVFHLHNESFNIYSHGFAFCYFLYVLATHTVVWQYEQFTLLIYLNYVTTLLPFFLSVVYHVFMCHCGGPAVYNHLLKVDVFGVWTTTTLATIPVMYTGLYCWPVLRDSYLLVYTLVSTAVLYALMKSTNKQGRVVALTMQYIFRLIGLILRLSPIGTGYLASIWLYVLIEIIAGPAAVINAFHIPERWFPGKLDYIFNGHSLMHIAAIVCIHLGGQAFLLDMEWLNSGPTCQ